MKHLALGCGGLMLALILVLAGWWYWLELTPAVAVPARTLPSPNAYDEYMAAVNGLVERESIGDLLQSAPAPSPGVLPPGLARSAPTTPPDPDAVVRKNRPALDRMRAGFRYEYADPSVEAPEAPRLHLSGFRDLARLLRVEARLRSLRGDWPGAISVNLDGLHFGEDISRGDYLALLVGHAVQAIVRTDAWDAVNQLNAQDARAAAARLERILDRGISLPAAVEEERRSTTHSLLHTFRSRNWRKTLTLDPSGTSAPPANWDEWKHEIALRVTSKSTVMSNYRRYMDALIAEAKKPYPQRTNPPEPDDPVNASGTSMAGDIFKQRASVETYNTLLCAMLALRAHVLERGAYPSSLQGLIPRYLRKVPNDPFGTGPLKYRRTREKYLLYSLGPDGKDGGGTPAPVTRRGTGTRTLLLKSTPGDVVAGVNRG